jgi:hypothetical protein
MQPRLDAAMASQKDGADPMAVEPGLWHCTKIWVAIGAAPGLDDHVDYRSYRDDTNAKARAGGAFSQHTWPVPPVSHFRQ